MAGVTPSFGQPQSVVTTHTSCSAPPPRAVALFNGVPVAATNVAATNVTAKAAVAMALAVAGARGYAMM